MTANQQQFIEILHDAQSLSADKFERFLLFTEKCLICSLNFGEEYFNETKPFVKSQNAEKLEEITDKYIARLSTDGAGILIDGVKVD